MCSIGASLRVPIGPLSRVSRPVPSESEALRRYRARNALTRRSSRFGTKRCMSSCPAPSTPLSPRSSSPTLRIPHRLLRIHLLEHDPQESFAILPPLPLHRADQDRDHLPGDVSASRP